MMAAIMSWPLSEVSLCFLIWRYHVVCLSRSYSVQGSELYHMDLFEELPVFVRNSRLQNVLLCELEQKMTTTENSCDFLSLATK